MEGNGTGNLTAGHKIPKFLSRKGQGWAMGLRSYGICFPARGHKYRDFGLIIMGRFSGTAKSQALVKVKACPKTL